MLSANAEEPKEPKLNDETSVTDEKLYTKFNKEPL